MGPRARGSSIGWQVRQLGIQMIIKLAQYSDINGRIAKLRGENQHPLVGEQKWAYANSKRVDP